MAKKGLDFVASAPVDELVALDELPDRPLASLETIVNRRARRLPPLRVEGAVRRNVEAVDDRRGKRHRDHGEGNYGESALDPDHRGTPG